MQWEDFLVFMRKGNTNSIKFFAANQSIDNIGSVLTAMANTKGGFLFLGFDLKNYHLVGSQLERSDIEKLIKIHCNPYPVIKLDSIERLDKEVLVIEVCESHEKPYYFNNKCFIMDQANTKLSFLEKEAAQKSPIQSPKQNNTPNTENETNKQNTSYTKKDIDHITNELLGLTDTLDSSQKENHHNNDHSPHPKKEPIIINESLEKLNERQKQTIHFLRNHDSIKNKKYRELHQVSHKTAHLELVDLVEKGKIESKGSGRSTCYVLKDTEQVQMF